MLKVNNWDQAEILDNDTFVMHFSLICTKLYKSELMQAQVEAEVEYTDIVYESMITCMNVA